MWNKIKSKNGKIDLGLLKTIILIITIFTLLLSLILVKNIFVTIFIFLFIYELSTRVQEKKYFIFLKNLILILLLALFMFSITKVDFISKKYFDIFENIIKIFMYLEYLSIMYHLFKKQKKKEEKFKSLNKKPTFRELRSRKFNKFLEFNKEKITQYINTNSIESSSDYYKVLYKDLDKKTISDLEEYVHINYLRFYKNKQYTNAKYFDIINIIFILIHLAILLLAIFVR